MLRLLLTNMESIIFEDIATIIPKLKGQTNGVVWNGFSIMKSSFEKVANLFSEGKNEEALQDWEVIKSIYAKNINANVREDLCAAVESQLLDLGTEVEWALHDKAVREAPYYYDQIVSLEPLMTSVVNCYILKSNGIEIDWLDCRDIFQTDKNFGKAHLNLEFTTAQLSVLKNSASKKWIITQLGIASTDECENSILADIGELTALLK